jgi:hypothetical protein
MRMGRGHSCGRRALTACAVAFIGFLLAACQTDQLVTGSTPSGSANAIAFESIDGPPKPVFERLVAKLGAEADARKLSVVSRTANASWRVRLYLAAHVEGKKAAVTWVGDVFDASLERAFRISGEEPAGSARRDVWAQADDALLGRIAASALEALAAGINGERPASPAPEPVGSPVVAMAEPGR